MAAAIIAFCTRERLLIVLPRPAYAAMFSIFLLSAAASKISLLPLSAVLLCLEAWPLLRSSHSKVLAQVAVVLVAPWIIFYCPIALWTWVQSGSPFGPVLADAFASSIYSTGWVQEAFESTREVNQLPLTAVLQYIVIDYSPLIWLGVVGAIVGTDLSKPTRGMLAGLLTLQSILIYWLLPYSGRFLGGLHYGLVVAFACFVRADIQQRFASTRAIVAACVIFLAPWVAIQIYYAKQFFPVSLGLEKAAFYQRYIAFYADYVKLDRILPEDTVLLVQDFRLSAAYAPRPVFFDPADLPPGKEAVLFASPETVRAALSLGGYKLDDLLYENPEAVIASYRTPGRHSSFGPLQVVRLIRRYQ